MAQVRDDVIPEKLSAIVLDAAGALPSGAYGLERVLRRRRSHRRRTVTGLSLVGVMVLAVAVAIPLALRPAAVTPPTGDRSFPAQRLFYYAGDTGRLHLSRPGVGIRVPKGIVELDDRGELVVRANLGSEMFVQNVVGLPDGGLAVLDLRHRRPAVNNIPDMVYVLTVVGADGTVRATQAFPRAGTTLKFVGATGEAAYLLHGDQLVRHEFASEREQPVAAASRVRELVAEGWSVDSVVSDRVILIKDSGKDIAATLLNLSGAGETTTTLVGCAAFGKGKRPNLMLAPGGRHLACYTAPAGSSGKQLTPRLTITDLSTGRQLFTRDFAPDVVLGWYESLAWADDHTLRLGVMRLPAGADGVYDLREVLKLETIKI